MGRVDETSTNGWEILTPKKWSTLSFMGSSRSGASPKTPRMSSHVAKRTRTTCSGERLRGLGIVCCERAYRTYAERHILDGIRPDDERRYIR